MSDTVWVLSVTHKHGTNISVHRNQEGALNSLASYVAGEWSQEMPHGAILPEDDGAAIEAYFAHESHGEYYSIEECQLQD